MWLLKAGGCLIQFKYISLWIFGQLSSGCLIQVGCLIEVTTNTGLTVFNGKQCMSRSVGFRRQLIQCRSRSVGFFRSQLIWIYTVCKGRTYPGSAGQGIIFPNVKFTSFGNVDAERVLMLHCIFEQLKSSSALIRIFYVYGDELE